MDESLGLAFCLWFDCFSTRYTLFALVLGYQSYGLLIICGCLWLFIVAVFDYHTCPG
jgi:hypothetical protein